MFKSQFYEKLCFVITVMNGLSIIKLRASHDIKQETQGLLL